MSVPVPITPEVVEAAAKASWESIDEMVSLRARSSRDPWDTLPAGARIEHRRHAEAAIRAADEARGLTVECKWYGLSVAKRTTRSNKQRIVGPWTPLEES